MRVYIGSDHRGYKLKEKIVNWFKERNILFEDMGAYKLDLKDDYTLYAEKVSLMVRDKRGSRGVLLCGSGVGVDIVANKFDGIRASIGKSVEQVRLGRRDDNMNVLVIASEFTTETDAKSMLDVFINTRFSGKDRYRRRLREIKRIEANN